MNTKSKTGFTLIELMVVIILIGIIAGFAIPNFTKAVNKTHEKDSILQLTSIHAANLLYFSQQDEFLPTGSGDLDAINSGLGLNIIANDMTYTYAREDPDTDEYHACASLGSDFTIYVNEGALDSDNPCCQSGTDCPTLSACPGGPAC